jgi:hypothetical protein
MGSLVRRGVGSWRWCSARREPPPAPPWEGGENEMMSCPPESFVGFGRICFGVR